jgi:hypothetical protein
MSEISAKIRAIIAKADSTSNAFESSTFMEKAQKMMEEHGLSLLDLGSLDSDDPVGVDVDFYQSFKTTPYWETLATHLAYFFGCKLVVSHKSNGNKYHSIAGRESARVTYTLMWPFVMRQIKTMATADYKSGKFAHPKTAYRDLSIALALRLQTMTLAKQASGNDTRGINALVPVDLIDLALQERFPNLTPSKTKKVSLDEHAIKRTEGVSLFTQTGASKSALKIAGN